MNEETYRLQCLLDMAKDDCRAQWNHVKRLQAENEELRKQLALLTIA